MSTNPEKQPEKKQPEKPKPTDEVRPDIKPTPKILSMEIRTDSHDKK
jgi:hypothetical protein